MKIVEKQQGAVIVLKPEGPLIESAVLEFKQRVLKTLAQSMGRFIVDMSAVPYVDSAGLEGLVFVSEELAKGDSDIAAAQYESALNHYRTAWNTAVKL